MTKIVESDVYQMPMGRFECAEVSGAPTERILIVIECIAVAGPISLGQLTEIVGISRAAVWRLVATLRARGWVRMRLGDQKVELTHRVDKLFAQAQFSDEEFEDFFRTMADFEQSHDMTLELAAFRSNGHLTGLETTLRSRARETVEGVELLNDELALAVQMACTRPKLLRHLMAYSARASLAERTRIESGDHRSYIERLVGPIWAEDKESLCLPIVGPKGSPAAIRITSKTPTVCRSEMMKVAKRFHELNEDILRNACECLPPAFLALKVRLSF